MAVDRTRRRNVGLLDGHRKNDATKDYLDNSESRYPEKRNIENQPYSSFIIWLTTIIYITIVYLTVHWHFHSFPSAKSSLTSEHGPEAEIFFEDNARRHTTTLAGFGPRVTGSKANEVQAYNYIREQIAKTKSHIHTSKRMTIDLQIVSGSFLLENFVNENFYHVYKNMKNIVVKLSSTKEAADSVLINCHFDSATSSPGAGDNAVSCAVMLEILRVLSQSPKPFEHNIIFLFNGAEENILQASHGFITKHPWAETVKAFINLDSAGAGGKETVFQTGPENPWLVSAYEKAAPHPAGNIFGQEIFQSGAIPSDTDYRIFRDFGHIPGIDIAHMANGYIYHTLYDQPKYIPDGCLQRSGENILALTRELATTEKLADPGQDRYGTLVFFDLLGYIFISYPKNIGVLFNCMIVAAACLNILKKIYKKDTAAKLSFVKDLFGAISASIFVWIVAVVTTLCIGMILTGLGKAMFWYTHTYNIYLLYGVAALAVTLGIHEIFKVKFYRGKNPWLIEEMFFDASLMIWSCMTMCLTLAGIASTYLAVVWVLMPLLIRAFIVENLFSNWRSEASTYLTVNLACSSIPCIIYLHVIYCMFTVFVPIMGRAGVDVIPEVPISLLTALTVVTVTQSVIGSVYICKNMKSLLLSMLSLFIIVLVLVIFTPLGFPYSNNPASPTPQRMLSVHVNRNIYDKDGRLTKEESGIWSAPFDYNYIRHLMGSKFIKESKLAVCDGPYCGLPYLIPVEHILKVSSSYFYKTEKFQLTSTDVNVKLTGSQTIKPGVTRLSFNITGPDHMSIYVVPQDGVSLIGWSIDVGAPTPLRNSLINQTMYFIYYAHGEEPDEPWSFYMDLQFADGQRPPNLMELAVNGHYIHSGYQYTKPLQDYLDSFPEWAAPLPWVATYNLFKY